MLKRFFLHFSALIVYFSISSTAYAVGIITPLVSSLTGTAENKTTGVSSPSFDISVSGFYLTGSNKGIKNTVGIGYITETFSDSGGSGEYDGLSFFAATPFPLHKEKALSFWIGPKFGGSFLSNVVSDLTTDYMRFYVNGAAGLQYQVKPGLDLSVMAEIPLLEYSTFTFSSSNSNVTVGTDDVSVNRSGMLVYVGLSFDLESVAK